MQDQSELNDSFRLLVIASVATLVLWFIPFADIVTYPLRLFVTFVHEAGHALAALASLGSVGEIEIYSDGSGLTTTAGGSRLLISSAGYLSTTLAGSGLLLFLRRARNARAAALACSVLLIVMTLIYGGNLIAWGTGLLLGAGLMWLGLKAKLGLAHFLMSFLAIQLLLNAFYDLKTLMYISAFEPAIASDAQNISEATGGFIPAVAWAFLWTVISTVILALTLGVYYRGLKRRAALPEYDSPYLIEDKTSSSGKMF